MRRISTMVAALLLAAGAAQAYDQSPLLNLGATSFLDGAPPAGPGFYFTQYGAYYHANRLTDHDGDRIKQAPDVDVWASLSQVLYQSNQPILLDGKWGLDVILPFFYYDVDQHGVANNSLLGDLLIGPYLQWDPIIQDGRPVFVQRFELQFLVPTGNFDEDRALNPGSGFFSINPYWAATWFPAKRCEVSWRLHYLWNAENPDNRWQAGQAIHLNFATSYELIEKRLRVGINGYFLKAITESAHKGHGQSDTQEQVFGIGPGLLYSFSQDDHLFANLYFEMAAQNRPEGERFILRWVHHF